MHGSVVARNAALTMPVAIEPKRFKRGDFVVILTAE